MKEILACMQCHEVVEYAAINNDLTYEFTCKKGHSSVYVPQEPKFEILYEIGMHALHDHYVDAAVSRFAVSLERFYEFCIKYWLQSDRYNNVNLTREQYDEYWKQIKRSSERQFGAFSVLYAMKRSEHLNLPSFLKPQYTELRNDVIHKGYIPTYEEAENYAENIFNFIVPILNKMCELDRNYFSFEHKERCDKAKLNNKQLIYGTRPTILGRYRDKTFDEAFSQFKKAK